MVVRGNDLIVTGCGEDLDWLSQRLTSNIVHQPRHYIVHAIVCACGLSVAFCDLGCDHGHALSGNMDGDVSRDGPNKCGQEVVLAIRMFITWLWNACFIRMFITCHQLAIVHGEFHQEHKKSEGHLACTEALAVELVCVCCRMLQLRGPVLASSFPLLLGKGRGVGDTDMESRAQRQNSPCGASETPRFARTGSGAVKDAAKKLSENLEHVYDNEAVALNRCVMCSDTRCGNHHEISGCACASSKTIVVPVLFQ